MSIHLQAEGDWVEMLVLEGMPIGEPVVWHGPMVTESDQAMGAARMRYRNGEMGEWSHSDRAPVHWGSDRFADYGQVKQLPKVTNRVREWPAIPQQRL